MDPELSLRFASPEDQDFLFEVYASTRREEIAVFGWPQPQQDSFLRMQFGARTSSYAASYPHAHETIFLIGETRVGAMTVSRTPAEMCLVDIAFLPEYRSRGLGTKVLADLIRESQASALPLRLSVLRQNRAARLYQRMGFVPTSLDPMYIEMKYEEDRSVV